MPDQQFLKTCPDIAFLFGSSLQDAYRQGIKGPMREAYLIASPRAFSMQEIRQPADVYQGAFDEHVPQAMGRHMADSLPNATYHYYEKEGHISILRHAFCDYARQFNFWHGKSQKADVIC